MKRERRFLTTEVRATRKDGAGEAHISGYAAVYDDVYRYNIFDIEVEERIMPGAFTRALREKQDVRCLFNHDSNFVLGRTKAGTLTLDEDKRGLTYTCEPPTNPMAAGIVDSIQRGDVDGSSFGFTVRKQEWKEEKDAKGHLTKMVRQIVEIDTLYDVSPVTYPAYTGTSVEARMAELFPDGVPEELSAHVKDKRMGEAGGGCTCQCEECLANNCDDCSNPDCDDPNCEDGDRANHNKRKEVLAAKAQAEADTAAAAKAETDAAAERQRLQDRLTMIKASFD